MASGSMFSYCFPVLSSFLPGFYYTCHAMHWWLHGQKCYHDSGTCDICVYQLKDPVQHKRSPWKWNSREFVATLTKKQSQFNMTQCCLKQTVQIFKWWLNQVIILTLSTMNACWEMRGRDAGVATVLVWPKFYSSPISYVGRVIYWFSPWSTGFSPCTIERLAWRSVESDEISSPNIINLFFILLTNDPALASLYLQ